MSFVNDLIKVRKILRSSLHSLQPQRKGQSTFKLIKGLRCRSVYLIKLGHSSRMYSEKKKSEKDYFYEVVIKISYMNIINTFVLSFARMIFKQRLIKQQIFRIIAQ